jgi:hypothetical protein
MGDYADHDKGVKGHRLPLTPETNPTRAGGVVRCRLSGSLGHVAEKAQLDGEIARLKEEKGLTREDLTFNPHTCVWFVR